MRKKILICGIIIGIAIICLGSYKLVPEILANSKVVDVKKIDKMTQNEKISTSIDMMHGMANSLIESKDIWAKIPMTKQNVDKLMVLLNATENSTQKETLQQIANKWKLGNFTTVDEDHDIVWNMIDNATIGQATGINKDEVAKAVSNIK